MRTVLILLSLALFATEAQAISRYNSTALGCTQIQAIAQAEGAAVMRWIQPPNIDRFERVVANSNYCLSGEQARPASVPAADTGSCPVRVCKRCEWDRDGNFPSFNCY